MKAVHDPRPYKSFSVQITLGAGWRHEPPKFFGYMRRSLEEFLNLMGSYMPSWFDFEYVMDAEFSSVVVRGLSEDQEEVLKVLNLLESDFPSFYRDLGAGIEVSVFSGGIRKQIVEEFEEFDIESSGFPKLYSKPRRFLSLKELSRIEKHFLAYVFGKNGGEVFLEISRRGDRIQYGMKVSKIDISIEKEIKSYRAWITMRAESTLESVKLLTVMNVYSKKTASLEDLLKETENFNIASLARAFKEIEAVSERG